MLHRWKPEYNGKREDYWDKKMMSFSCARGSQNEEGLEGEVSPRKQNDPIIKELERMKKLYEIDNNRGKALGY